MRSCSNGSTVANMVVTTTRVGKNKEEVLYIDVAVFGAQAKPCGKFLTKGSTVLIQGYLKLNQWQDNKGNQRSNIQVIAHLVEFLTKGNGNGNHGGNGNHEDDYQEPPPPVTAGMTPPPADYTTPGWENKPVGLSTTGNLTWRDLAGGKKLPSGLSGRAYLKQLAEWKANPQVCKLARAALHLVGNHESTGGSLEPPMPCG